MKTMLIAVLMSTSAAMAAATDESAELYDNINNKLKAVVVQLKAANLLDEANVTELNGMRSPKQAGRLRDMITLAVTKTDIALAFGDKAASNIVNGLVQTGDTTEFLKKKEAAASATQLPD